MIPQTQLVLQSYFQTGDVPNQAQYLELIGTMFYYINALNTSVNNAVASINAAVAAIEAVAPQVICAFNSGVISGTAPSFIGGSGAQTNVASMAVVGANIRITFTTPFANTTWKPILQTNGAVTIATQNANYVDVVQGNNLKCYLWIWQ